MVSFGLCYTKARTFLDKLSSGKVSEGVMVMGTATVYKAVVPSDEELVRLSAHMTQKMLMAALQEYPLDCDQGDNVIHILGEAITNAYMHSSSGGEVIIEPKFSERGIELKISNPCEHFGCNARPDGVLEEHGRGLILIKNSVEELCSSGLQAESSCKSNSIPEGGREVVFSFSLYFEEDEYPVVLPQG